MDKEIQKIKKANEIICKMGNGINPINGEPIEESFLNDERMKRCLFFISKILEKEIIRMNNGGTTKFIITDTEKSKVILPDENIGVNEFAKLINNVIDLSISRSLTGLVLNKQLKRMGLLGEQKLENGKYRSIINEKSAEVGIEMIKANYEGNVYDKVVFNDKGKKFLLENLDKIMGYNGDKD